LIELTYESISIIGIIQCAVLWWLLSATKRDAYQEGYGDACYDVAHGNITVSLTPPSEMDR